MVNIPPTKLKKWKVIESKDLSYNHWTPVQADKVEIKDSKTIDFYIITMGPASMVFPITKDKKIVLVRQYKHGAGDIIIEGPAGIVDEDETPEQAAIRELEEEAGIKDEESKLIYLGTHIQSPTKNTHTVAGYIIFDVEFNSKQNLDEHEDIEVITVTPNEAIEMIGSGEIYASDTVAFLLKIKLKYPELFN